MENPFSKEQVFAAVRESLARVLGMSPADIGSDQSMVDDLGAESLDFVELNAIVEKSFNFFLPSRSVLDHAGKVSGQPERFYHPKTGLTAEGVELLAQSPYHYTQVAVGNSTYDIFNASTPGNLAGICHEIFNHLPASCPSCGHSEARVSLAGKVVCAECNGALRPAHGDEVLARWVGTWLAAK